MTSYFRKMSAALLFSSLLQLSTVHFGHMLSFSSYLCCESLCYIAGRLLHPGCPFGSVCLARDWWWLLGRRRWPKTVQNCNLSRRASARQARRIRSHKRLFMCQVATVQLWQAFLPLLASWHVNGGLDLQLLQSLHPCAEHAYRFIFCPSC